MESYKINKIGELEKEATISVKIFFARKNAINKGSDEKTSDVVGELEMIYRESIIYISDIFFILFTIGEVLGGFCN